MTYKNLDLDHNYLIENIDYNKDTGIFTWKKTGKSRKRGPLGTDDGEGYLQIQFTKKKYRLNRLAWFYVNGEWPPEDKFVDHINKDRSDNKWDNFRLVDRSQSQMNRTCQSNNVLGHKNIGYKKVDRKNGTVDIYYNVIITVKGKRVVDKTFKDLESAIKYRDEVLPLYHGEYASF